MDDRLVTLAPHSGVQFVELPLDLAKVTRFQRDFVERPEQVPKGAERRAILLGLWNEDEPDGDPLLHPQPGDDEYTINKDKAVEAFLGKWLPIPFLRLLPGIDSFGREAFDRGPTNWARMRITANPGGRSGATHLVMLAFDTEPLDRRPNQRYQGPSRTEIENATDYRFVSRMSQLGWFISDPHLSEKTKEKLDFQEWVPEWIETAYLEFRQAQAKARGRTFRREDLEFKLEHLARYFALIDLIQLHAKPPTVKLINTFTGPNASRPVTVDLLLDIGNSRTCGMLIETFPNNRPPI
jgi:hypothetical protein